MTAPRRIDRSKVAVEKVVRTERLELVDAEGNIRCRIGPRSRRGAASFDIDLFDAAGRIVANVSTDVVSGDSGVVVGAFPGPRASLRARTSAPWGESQELGHAELVLDSGYKDVRSETTWQAVAHQGSAAGSWSWQITLDHFQKEVPFIDSHGTLDIVIADASRKLRHIEDQARESRADGDLLKARRERAMARKLERLMEATRRAFEERQASAKKPARRKRASS